MEERISWRAAAAFLHFSHPAFRVRFLLKNKKEQELVNNGFF